MGKCISQCAALPNTNAIKRNLDNLEDNSAKIINELYDLLEFNENQDNELNEKFNEKLFGSDCIIHLILRLNKIFTLSDFRKLINKENIKYDIIGQDFMTPLMISCQFRINDPTFTEIIIDSYQSNHHHDISSYKYKQSDGNSLIEIPEFQIMHWNLVYMQIIINHGNY